MSDIIESNPENLKPKLTVKDGAVLIDPLLVNSSDEFSFQAIAKGSVEGISITARIGGINEIVNVDDNRKELKSDLSWLLLIYALICFISYSLVVPIALNRNSLVSIKPISSGGGKLLVLSVIIPAIVALFYFKEINDLKPNWSWVIYFVIFSIFSDLVAGKYLTKEEKEVRSK